MISFDNFKAEGRSPVYLQIISFVKRGVAAGSIVDGDELPSRRMLSALLGINPNTVQKAFAQLEREGLIWSGTGAKSYMTISPKRLELLREELLRDDVMLLISSLKQSGISREEALELISSNWDREEEADPEGEEL
ncbi:MAG: GntR family transcriptional regulator [Firmicutes bacterium]|nr:GntR family transcriptional regulator [Bacillota bacterium]